MSAPDEAVRRIMDGTSWEEFCDTLKAAGSVVLSEASPDDPFNRAEGWRYLTRLTRAALESFVEAGDPQAPEFQRTAHETIKMGMDNPDNIYGERTDQRQLHVSASRAIAVASTTWVSGPRCRELRSDWHASNTTGYLDAKDMQIGRRRDRSRSWSAPN